KNNSSLTIKAPGKDIYLSSDTDFEGDKNLDLGLKNLSDLAIGYTISLGGGFQLGAGGNASGTVSNVMYFNSKYGGYWYSYRGLDVQLKAGLGAEFSGALTGNVFIAVSKTHKYNPNSFAGETMSYGLDFAIEALAGV